MLVLHADDGNGDCTECGVDAYESAVPWPCPTAVLALAGAPVDRASLSRMAYGALSDPWRLKAGVPVEADPGIEPAMAQATSRLIVAVKRDHVTLDLPIRYELDRSAYDPAQVILRAVGRVAPKATE